MYTNLSLKKRQQTVIDERNSADTVGLIFNKGYKENIMTVFTKIFLKMPVELTKKTQSELERSFATKNQKNDMYINIYVYIYNIDK